MEPIETGSFSSSELAECPTTLRIVSWNIARGSKLEAIIEFLAAANADIILLQEADKHARRTNYRNVAREIAQRLKVHYAFGCEFEELSARFACSSRPPWSSHPLALATVRYLYLALPKAIEFLAPSLVPSFACPAAAKAWGTHGSPDPSAHSWQNFGCL